MNDEERIALATDIVRINQRYFWSPERKGERMKITRVFNILKDVENRGYRIVKYEPGVEK